MLGLLGSCTTEQIPTAFVMVLLISAYIKLYNTSLYCELSTPHPLHPIDTLYRPVYIDTVTHNVTTTHNTYDQSIQPRPPWRYQYTTYEHRQHTAQTYQGYTAEKDQRPHPQNVHH